MLLDEHLCFQQAVVQDPMVLNHLVIVIYDLSKFFLKK